MTKEELAEVDSAEAQQFKRIMIEEDSEGEEELEQLS